MYWPVSFCLNFQFNVFINFSYQVVEGPGQGEIELGTNLEPLKTTIFSQAELEAGHVRYRHNGDVESIRDRVLFRVSAGSTVSREIEFDIRLLPQNYWEPLEVTKNSPIIVDESTTIAVTKQYLEVIIINNLYIYYCILCNKYLLVFNQFSFYIYHKL